MWELIPGVVVAVPLPQRWVLAVSCVMASQRISRVVGYCVQVIHSTLCRERQHSQSKLAQQVLIKSSWIWKIHELSSSSADTHRCLLMQTPAGPVLWEGSLHMWRVCWLGCLSLRNVSGLRGTLSQGTEISFSSGCFCWQCMQLLELRVMRAEIMGQKKQNKS